MSFRRTDGTEVTLPPATRKPCSDCPWRRNAKPGWLGPHTAYEWLGQVHGETAIACHQTIVRTNDEGTGDWEDPAMRQCRGAAIFRENVGKTPRDPTVACGPAGEHNVFESNEEFYDYHCADEFDLRKMIDHLYGGVGK